MKTITRQEAIAKGLPRYFTGNNCSKGHAAERYTSNKTCCDCANATANKTKTKNRKKYTQSSVDWLRQNPKKSAVYSRKYGLKNKGNRNLWTANYRSAKDERQPSWLNAGHLFEMESIYNYCAALRSAGLDYHVDHIVPLRGNTVSGLHVPWNLQVITGAENMSKGNCFNG
jgi:hypothetical protein